MIITRSTIGVLHELTYYFKGGDVISIEQPRYSIYEKDPNEVLINGMFELLDEYERISIALKLAKGRTTKANKGHKPAGVTPYGYKYSDDKKSVIVDDSEAVTIKKIFSAAQTGQTLQKIVDILNVGGLTTRQGMDESNRTRYAAQHVLYRCTHPPERNHNRKP